MGSLQLYLIVSLSWAFFFPYTHQLQSSQTQILLQIRKHLEYPSSLEVMNTFDGDLCNVSPSREMTIACQNNVVTELRIMGDKFVKFRGFNGVPIPNQTLSERFSIGSFVTTLSRLSSLRVLSLISLGIWGPLPEKIHRLSSLEFLDLSSNFIFGQIPPKISTMVQLYSMVLDGNYFNDTVPDWLDSLTNLTFLSLKRNRLTGQFPSSLCRIRTLADVSLSHNEISGELPDLSALTNLNVLDMRDNKLNSVLPVMPKGLVTLLLSKNALSGEIPKHFGRMAQLQHLDLSSNQLTRSPPPFLFNLPNITYLNLASNKMSGSLPNPLRCSTKLGYVDISDNKLTGALPTCLGSSSDKRMVKFGGNCFSSDLQHQHEASFCAESLTETGKSRRIEKLLIVAAFVSGAIILIVLLPFGLIFLYRRLCKRTVQELSVPPKVVQENSTTAVPSELLASARFISQAMKLGAQTVPMCRSFSFQELKDATKDFDKSMLLGEGSIGKLYRGKLENGTLVAVRCLPLSKKYSVQNLKVRLDVLSKLHHPHLVGLFGHCIEGDGHDYSTVKQVVLLVYEYVSTGNYRTLLTETYPEKVLKWSDRLTILIGVAKAIHFLHTGVIPGSFNNRLKTNNILLDEHRIPKLSDYGTSIITEEIEKHEAKGEGTKSRKNLVEDDVYNFGYILLESLVGPIVTGREETFLLNDMASFGSTDGRRRIVDPVVLTTCSQESLSRVISITKKCISTDVLSRPSFEDVLWNLQYAAQVQASTDAEQKSDSIS
ncbi:probable inactive leucine-rich repeat receptor-like protein kinase At3g03770 isoform X2 [Cucurbita moschata]|uniref:Probable inactive leucine-rich repeat receptor-like protein kinase At3g03770 isoform X2 n=1 Tax=Cucurbita moschata TaxID=3662 RepID=A0A6J1GTB9_CUCMO|nr:probable inactive leucine-rich repeat receptor-like protein kinase At3g03770 isoform X2 [Cucurbita moschata]